MDADIAGGVRSGADTAVVIAVAPSRMDTAVVTRAEVVCEYLSAKGIQVYAVHVRALREGALWTALRGRALAGAVPAVRRPASTRHYRARVPHRRAGTVGARPRLLVAVCAVAVTLLGGPHAVGAPPVGQPGLIADPPSTGQAGLIAAQSPATPAGSTGDALGTSSSAENTEILAQPSPPTTESFERVTGSSSGRVFGPSMPARPRQPAVEPLSAAPSVVQQADVLRVGAATLPRPEWMPAQLAAREQQWNGYLTEQIAAAVDESGLQIPCAEHLLGTGGQPVPEPSELAWIKEAAVEPHALIPVAAQAADALVSAVAGQPHPDPWPVLGQLPVWG
ncbi:hypothetical protein IU474_16830 [Nocardia otitidiscaviarum]|uniref:hypothetical protein n=1 Tax=Nocardia otitidiscaviarum TaxID=1823 RepID=UPI00189540C8|nr:hypothetical protein [Nocardia otitidiscaviarum]MBF6238716.1 hypothetical protein [Nocardia otitidiscaviarum]